MKKIIIVILLAFSLITLSISLWYKNNVHSFNSQEVVKNIAKFSSEQYKGRLAGSLENDEATFELKEYLKEGKIKPLDGNYYDSFTTDVPNRIEGKPYLKVTDKSGSIIKTFDYSSDYKEDMLNFKANSFSFNNKDTIGLKDTVLQVQKDSNYFIFYVPQSNSLSFRSSFMETSLHSMYVMVTDSTFNQIKDYVKKGYSVSCFIPYEIKNKQINNVVGFIKGKNSTAPPIIISAHFDHVGTDLSGNVFPGALDNASGVSFVMELEKYIKSLGKPDRNIIFAFFNAEELGCQGSTHFANEYKNKFGKSKVFNFDMIGSNNNIPLSIMAGSNDTKKTPLVKEISSVCTYNKVQFKTMFEDSSDHEAFRNDNIQAVTFCDDDLTRIHTSNDTSNFISTKSIDRCFSVASDEIASCAFRRNFLLIYYSRAIKYSLICSIFLIIAYLFIKIKDLVEKNR